MYPNNVRFWPLTCSNIIIIKLCTYFLKLIAEYLFKYIIYGRKSSKIAKKVAIYWYMFFWPLLGHFWANCNNILHGILGYFNKILHGISRNYYIFIVREKSSIWCLLLKLFSPLFFLKMGGAPPRGLGPQNPTKKLAHWVELFGTIVISKSWFWNFEIFWPPRGLRSRLIDL